MDTPLLQEIKKDKLIWLHAASLGEVASATSLAIGFKEANYKGLILITSGTKTSSEFTKNYKDIIHQYHPLDKKKWVNRFISFLGARYFNCNGIRYLAEFNFVF